MQTTRTTAVSRLEASTKRGKRTEHNKTELPFRFGCWSSLFSPVLSLYVTPLVIKWFAQPWASDWALTRVWTQLLSSRKTSVVVVVVVVVVVTRSDQPKPPAVAIVHQNGLSSASCRASVAVTPMSRQNWWKTSGRQLSRTPTSNNRERWGLHEAAFLQTDALLPVSSLKTLLRQLISSDKLLHSVPRLALALSAKAVSVSAPSVWNSPS